MMYLMNIILFEEKELSEGFSKKDFRCEHIFSILKKEIGEEFSAGVINKSAGVASISKITDRVYFNYTPQTEKINRCPIKIICGFTRPPVARRILKDCATAGIEEINFICVENSEKSYSQSKLWTTNDYMIALLEGAQQGKNFFFPNILLWRSVSHFLSKFNFSGDKILLDNIIGSKPFANHLLANKETKATAIAIGAERGWVDLERNNFLSNGFMPLSLGNRIYRTEVAVSSSVVMTQNLKEI